MRRRLTAVLLSITVIATCLFPTIVTKTAAANATELFTNGSFATNTAGVPDGWTFNNGGNGTKLTGAVDDTDLSPAGSKSFKFTQTAQVSSAACFYNTNAIALKTNADYSLTMWVKSQNVKGLRFYLYEPNYTDRAGVAKTLATPQEGQNIFSYAYDNGTTTHVARTNIIHTFKLKNQSGTNVQTLSSSNYSLATVKDTASNMLDVTSDFPGQTKPNEWVQLIYTFSTSMATADVGNVRFGIVLKDGLPNAGTASIADISFTETKKPFPFTPTVNKADLGGVFPKSISITAPDQNLTFTANPVDGNSFVKWTKNGQDYSTNPTVTGTFTETDNLQAVFSEGNIVTNAGAELYAKNKDVANNEPNLKTVVLYDKVITTKEIYKVVPRNGTGDWYMVNNNGKLPVVSWPSATVSQDQAHNGIQSVKIAGQYQVAMRKLTGLTMNKEYNLSFWYYMPAYNDTGKNVFNWSSVLPASAVATELTTAQSKDSNGNLLYDNISTANPAGDATNGNPVVLTRLNLQNPGNNALTTQAFNKRSDGTWNYVTLSFNSKDNTDVYLSMSYASAVGDPLFVDDIGLSSGSLVNVTTASTAGGTISASRTGSVPKDLAIGFLATPDAGCTFLGWYDGNDKTKLISDKLSYTTTASADINLFAKYDIAQVAIQSVGLGGSATVSKSGPVPKGASVTFTATPLAGNTFKGWFNVSDSKLVSDQPKYTTTVTADIILTAEFNGYNKPPVEILKNGTFETGTITGWFGDDPVYNTPDQLSWLNWAPSTDRAYEGTHSLKVSARHRDSILPLTNLNRNSNYRLSFYAYEDSRMANLTNAFIAPPGVTNAASGGGILMAKVTGPLPGGPGWQKIELSFNTGELSTVNFGLHFAAEVPATTTYPLSDAMYIDNMQLFEYSASDTLVNGNFDSGTDGFIGSYTVTGDKEASMVGDSASIAQTMKVTPFTDYLVSFRAKTSDTSTKVKAAAVNLANNSITNKGLITSYSYVDATGTDWTDYSFAFNTGENPAVNLIFDNIGTGTSLVDSISMVAKADAALGKIEVIDFETDRFNVSDYYTIDPLPIITIQDANKNTIVIPSLPRDPLQSEAFEIYHKAPNTTDPNVRSGDSSLKIKYDPEHNNVEKVLQQIWTSFPVQAGGSYCLTLWYRTELAQSGVKISPDATGAYYEETDQLSENSGWTKLRINITNKKGYSYVRMIMGNISTTKSNVYIDDIVFQLTPPMVTEENTRLLYSELLYNTVKNQSFELPTTDADWGASLPSNFKIVDTSNSNGKDKAPTQQKYLHVSQSDGKYVLKVPTKAGQEYGFGAFVRGKAKTNAYIGISADPEGKNFFINNDEQPASKVSVTMFDGGWHRSGFKFISSATGYTYIVIEAKGGSIDIDNVMLFETYYGYRFDPNDYSVYVPYNYDDLTHHTAINGGVGPQPYLDEPGEDSNNPSNGDNLPLTMSVFALTAGLSLLAIFATGSKRRKGGANSDE